MVATTPEIDTPYFHKEMLRVGTYHSPDGVVPVTRERIEHWAKEHKRLVENGFSVPMAFDHGTTVEDIVPKDAKEVDRILSSRIPSAANTVGKLASFEPSPDGNGCNLVFEITESKAKDQAKSNRVEISPIVLPYWKDGKGNEYRDICTHFDLVTHAVDHSQTPFTPLRMSADAVALRPIRFSLTSPPMADDEKDEKKDEETSESGESKEGNPAEPAPGGTANDQATTSSANPTELLMHQVIGGLRTKGIPMPDSCDLPTFLQAIMAALPKIQIGSANGNMGPTTALDQVGQVQQPGAQLMSSTPSNLQAFAENAHRQIVARRLKDLSETGRCTPTELAAKKIELSAVKLSLDEKGGPVLGKLETWIAGREELPEFSLVPKKEAPPVTRLSSDGVQQPPGEFGGDARGNHDEDEEVDRQLTRFYGRKKVEEWTKRSEANAK